MLNRNFDEWIAKFRKSISTYDYYINFDKVVKNVEEKRVELKCTPKVGHKLTFGGVLFYE